MYTIYAGGICIFDDADPSLETKLINPTLQLNAGAAGSLTMTVPKTNAGYADISRLTTTIKVKRDGTEIWRGRVLTESKDLWNNRVLFCEGCLAFLNDSIQSSSTAVTGQVPAYISALLTNHNNKVAINRQISLGTVSVEDPAGAVSRYLNGETTLALLQKLVNELGGVLRTRFSGETILLDYLKEYPASGTLNPDYGTLESGYIRASNGVVMSSATFHTDYVDLTHRPAGSQLKYSRLVYTNSSVWAGIAFYDSGKTYISGVTAGTRASANHYEDSTCDIPSNAAYVRLTAFDPEIISGFYVSLVWSSGLAAQSIDLEENLLDFTRDWDNTDFCTVVLPRGARQDSEDSNLQSYLDVSAATAPTGYTKLNGVYLGKDSLVNAYGRLEKIVEYSDIESAQTLLNTAKDYLDNQQYNGMSLELTALDLHITDRAVQAWNLLDVVTVKARPYFTGGKTFAITGMQIPLDAPEKTRYTLGPEAVPKKRRVLSLTKQQNQAAQELADNIADSSSFAEDSAVKKSGDYTDGEVVSVKEWVDNDSEVCLAITEYDTQTGEPVKISSSEIKATAHDVYMAVSDDGSMAGTLITSREIKSQVTDSNGNYTCLRLEADGLHVADDSGTTTISGDCLTAGTVIADDIRGNAISILDGDDTEAGWINTRASSVYSNDVVEINGDEGLSLVSYQVDPDTYTPSGGYVFIKAYNDVILESESGEIQCNGSFTPGTDNLYFCGYPGNAWADIYITDSNGNAVSVKQALGI